MRKKHGAYESVRDAITDTASQLFVIQGVHATSLNDIAAKADLSKGTLYYYYPTKESLVLDIAQHNISAVTDAIFIWVDTLARGTPVREAMDMLLNILLKDKQLLMVHMVVCAEAALGEESLQEMLSACYKEWSVMLEVGALKIQARRAPGMRTNAKLFFTLLSGYLVHRNGRILDISKDDLLDFMLI